jgi:phage terminase large subunit
VIARDFSGNGQSRLAMAESLGLRPSVVATRGSIGDGIQAVRSMFPRLVFDKDKCHEGLEALKAYRREWNETRKDWVDHPLHDWSSHAADSLRTFCTTYQDLTTASKPATAARLAGVPDALQWMG